jgi:murein DD-endopeptidase MepM/ murein hydrolase activator NlpD
MRKYNTIIFVPHATARFRKITISSRLLAAGAVAALLLLVASVAFGWAFFASARRDRHYRLAMAENARLKSSTVKLSGRLEGLSRKIEGFESRARQLAIVAGLPQSGRGGAGGPATTRWPEHPSLEGRSELLGTQLDRIESRLAERRRLASSTPTVAPVRGLLHSGFGPRRDPFTGSPAFHGGLDISTRRDEPVLATADGVVVKSGWMGDYGKAVEIEHSTGYRTLYGHLDEILVRDGESVRRGSRIGLVGSTGRSTSPHLHYEVRRAGRIVNPLEFILDAR